MSDYSISIVPKLSSYPDKEKKAKEILDWLISLDIVKPILSDCVLGSDNGYAISDGAKKISNDPDNLPYRLATNGLDIITERQIFDTAENGIEELICPNCKQDISSEEWDFFDEWSTEESNNLTCPLCNTGKDIHEFKFTPDWGFSNLGFTFWNWCGLTDNFINEFQQRLGCNVSIVYQHL
jgi:hypothetical protein